MDFFSGYAASNYSDEDDSKLDLHAYMLRILSAMKLQNRIIAALGTAGKPLSFEQIYSALEGDGHPLPKDKPKLKVRQTLYKKDCFDVQKGGVFYLKDDAIVEEQEAVAPTQPASEPVAPVQSAEQVKVPDGPKIKDRIIAILKDAGKPMTFEDVYSALEKDGFPLPKSKPKLKARQVLYKPEYFSVAKGGLFTVNDGVEAEVFEKPKPEAAPEAPQAAPVQNAPVQNADVPKIKDRIIMALQQAGKPLSFQKIYEALEHDGYPLPKSKPKLIARQTLYSAEYFTVEKGGLFALADGVSAEIETDKPSEIAKSEDVPSVDVPDVNPAPVPTMTASDTADIVEQVREEARIAAREAAAQAREEAIREAREEAKLAAQEAAAEVAREAALEAVKMAEENEKTKRMAIEAAVEAARSAALDAAREAARIALSETTRAVAEAAAEEAKRISGNHIEAAVPPTADIDPVDQELLAAARAAREAIAQASAAVDNSLQMNVVKTTSPSPAEQPKPAAPVSKGASIRARTVQALKTAGRPLSLEEIMTELGKDGHPLPMNNAEQVVQRVVDNVNNFEQVEPGLYFVKDA